MLADDLRKLPEKELLDKTKEIRERLFNLSFKSATEPVTNPAEVTELRKDRARIHGILGERKRKGAPARLRLSREERRVLTERAARMKAEAEKKAASVAKPKAKKKSPGKNQVTAKKA